MATSFGNIVQVSTLEEFERMLILPTSITGWYDPDVHYGVVTFPTQHAAQSARRML